MSAAELEALGESRDLATCDLEIFQSDLRDLDLLADVPELLSLSLVANTLLDDLSGVAALRARSLYASDNPLRSVTVLPSTVPTITIQGSDVAELSWEPSHEGDEPALFLAAVPALSSVEVRGVSKMDAIKIRGATQFRGLAAAFPSLSALDSLSISECPLVTTAEIEALAALVEDPGRVHHCGNADDEPCPEAVEEN